MEPFAFQWGQAAYKTGSLHDAFVLADKLVVHALVVGITDGTHCLLIGRLADEVGCILVLPGALCAGNILILEHIHTLAGKDCVMVGRRQCIGNVRLTPETVSAVFDLTVNDIPRNAEAVRLLRDKGRISASHSKSC